MTGGRLNRVIWMAWLGGCGLKQMLPEGPVVDDAARAAIVAGAPSGVAYTGEPRAEVPVLPLIAWGAAYDLDLVLVDRHPDWDMHEIAMIRGPDGPVWLAKDARIGTLEQTVVTDAPDPGAWMPELPVQRRGGPIEVDDRSTADWLDLDVRWTNHEGQRVEVHYEGRPPIEGPQPKRNGSTMGHSRDQLMAVLDLSHRTFARRASVTIDGEAQRVVRIAGLVPFRMALIQAQAGFATGTMAITPAEGGFTVAYATGSADWRWERDAEGWAATQDDGMRQLVYRFRDEAGAAELVGIEVRQWGRDAPVMTVAIGPALPDLRRPWEGPVLSRYVIDVNGQPGHAVGVLEAWWEADGPRVELTPTAPWWTADRPMRTRVTFPGDGSAAVAVERVPTDARSGTGAKNASPAR